MRPIDADELMEVFMETDEGISTHTAQWIEDCVDSVPLIEIPQWIPCSERLPEQAGMSCLLSVKTNGVYSTPKVIQGFTGYGDYTFRTNLGGVDMRDVIVGAWMPLPEPYRE